MLLGRFIHMVVDYDRLLYMLGMMSLAAPPDHTIAKFPVRPARQHCAMRREACYE